MKVTITTPYATLEAELTAHQAKDILHTAMGYAANNADKVKSAPPGYFAPWEGHPPTWGEEMEPATKSVQVNGPVLGEGEVLDHA